MENITGYVSETCVVSPPSESPSDKFVNRNLKPGLHKR
jgi:hypothetical protein